MFKSLLSLLLFIHCASLGFAQSQWIIEKKWAFKTGDDVRHPKFGDGVVLSISGSGDNAEVTVHFAEVGEKTLLLGWASLQSLQ